MVKFKNQWTGRQAMLAKAQRLLNTANANVASRDRPITLPRVSMQEKEAPTFDDEPRMCAGDIYREHVYKREWFPEWKEHK